MSTEKTAKHGAGPQAPAVVGGGLVPYTTTQTECVEIDLIHSRLGRMANGVRTSARLHCEAFGNDRNRFKCVMWTLTYRNTGDWKPEHVRDFLTTARQYFKRRNVQLRYAWVAELQQRGAVHYHILVWVPTWCRVPYPDQKRWWRHGFTNTKRVAAPVKYAVKYTSKGTSDIQRFPKGARLFGVGGLDAPQRNERIWWSMPRYVREKSSVEDQPRRRSGGGFVLRGTGELLLSEWLFVSCGAGRVRIRRRTAEDGVGYAEVRNAVSPGERIGA